MKTKLLTIITLCLIGLLFLAPRASADQVKWDISYTQVLGYEFNEQGQLKLSEDKFTGSIIADTRDFTPISCDPSSYFFTPFTYNNPNAKGSFTFLSHDGSSYSHDFTGVDVGISPGYNIGSDL